MCMERLKTDLGIFPSPSSFAEARSFASFHKLALASVARLGHGACVASALSPEPSLQPPSSHFYGPISKSLPFFECMA